METFERMRITVKSQFVHLILDITMYNSKRYDDIIFLLLHIVSMSNNKCTNCDFTVHAFSQKFPLILYLFWSILEFSIYICVYGVMFSRNKLSQYYNSELVQFLDISSHRNIKNCDRNSNATHTLKYFHVRSLCQFVFFPFTRNFASS